MRNTVKYIGCFIASALLVCGCEKNTSSAPTPMPAEEMPAAFAKAFAKSDPQVQQQANRFLAALQKHDTSEAFQEIQILAVSPNLTDDQRFMIGRARVTVTQQLQSAAASGDTKSAEAMQAYMSTR